MAPQIIKGVAPTQKDISAKGTLIATHKYSQIQ
jgi:hypothetical protein